MEQVTMYRTKEGKLYDNKKDAVIAETTEELRRKLFQIGRECDFTDEEIDTFVQLTIANTAEINKLLTLYFKHIDET